MIPAILRISNGKQTVDLLQDRGINVQEYLSGFPEAKEDGIWHDNVFSNGRRPYMIRWNNIIDTLTFNITSSCTDTTIDKLRSLIRLLMQANNYFTTPWNSTPVWIEARTHNESRTRYAVIYNFSFAEIEGAFGNLLAAITRSTLRNVELVIEHGYWQSDIPGIPVPLPISSLTYSGKIINASIPIAMNSDNKTTAIVRYPGYDDYIVLPDSDKLYITRIPSPNNENTQDTYQASLSFEPSIPQGAAIIRSVLRLYNLPVQTDWPLVNQLRILQEENPTATPFGVTYDDIRNDRTWTDTWGGFFYPNGAPEGYVSSVAIAADFEDMYGVEYAPYTPEEALQRLVADPSWSASSRYNLSVIARFTKGESREVIREIASRMNPKNKSPQLDVAYSLPITAGQERTTLPSVFTVNRQNKAQITNVFGCRPGSPDSFVDVLSSTFPVNYFPDGIIKSGDILYFGIADDADFPGTFSNVVVNSSGVDPSNVGISSTVWEYWNGAIWVALSTVSMFEHQFILRPGVSGVSFQPKPDWVMSTVNGIYGYWIRAKISISGGYPTTMPTPKQMDRNVYSALTPHVDIERADVSGDLSADIKAVVNVSGDWNTAKESIKVNRCLIASRSLSRGTSFEPFIPMSQDQQPNGVQVSVVAGVSVFEERIIDSPYDEVCKADLGTANTWKNVFNITIASDIAKEYVGQFRVYLRAYRYSAGASAPVRFNGRVTVGSSGVFSAMANEPILAVNKRYQLLELGFLNMPLLSDYIQADAFNDLVISVNALSSDAADPIYIYDLVLMPIDELVMDAIDESKKMPAGYNDTIEFDGITQSKGRARAWVRSKDNTIKAFYTLMSSEKIALQPNERQRLYLMTSRFDSNGVEISSPWQLNTLQMFKSEFYVSMRGSQ